MNAHHLDDSALDFELLTALAKHDQEAFENFRQEKIKDAIDRAAIRGCSKKRLEGLQFRIDLERQRARTPLKACLRLSSMMWDSFLELDDLIKQRAYTRCHFNANSISSSRLQTDHLSGKVIQFPRKI